MEKKLIDSTKSAVNDLVNLSLLGERSLWVDYDKNADVLYINYDKPRKADDSEQTDEGIIKRTRNKKLVGITILEASRFKK